MAAMNKLADFTKLAARAAEEAATSRGGQIAKKVAAPPVKPMSQYSLPNMANGYVPPKTAKELMGPSNRSIKNRQPKPLSKRKQEQQAKQEAKDAARQQRVSERNKKREKYERRTGVKRKSVEAAAPPVTPVTPAATSLPTYSTPRANSEPRPIERGNRRTKEQRKAEKSASPRTYSTRTARERQKAERKGKAPTQSPRTANNDAIFDSVTTSDNFFKNIAGTAGTGMRSAFKNLSEGDNLKRAGIGMLQTSAVSAVGHGGLAAIQGEDPWEAAKTGAIRGAMIGGGYQGLKAATYSNAGSIRGNIKSIAGTGKQMHQAHTTAGNAALKSGQQKMSGQLLQVLNQGKRSDNVNSIFGF